MLVYIIGVTGLLYWILTNYAYDDPYITYRYASQLAHGQGFVYNSGERVLSTTTPLFTMVLALGSFIWADIPHLANFVGCISLALGGLSLWWLSRAWKQPGAGWAGLWLYPSFALLLSTIGSETPLYLAFCLGALASYAHRRYNFAALLAALAVLTRGDGFLIAILLAAHYLLVIRGRIPWGAVGIFAGILLPWVVFSWIYFGSPLPATLAAKQHQGAMAISQRFAAGFITVARPYSLKLLYRIEAVLAVFGLVYLVWRARSWGLLISWTILYFVAFSALGVSRYLWYYAPLVPGFMVLVGLGIDCLAEVGSKFVGVIKKYHASLGIGSSYFILATLLPLPFIGAQFTGVWQMHSQVDTRAEIYQAIGDWLRTNTTAESKVGTLEVGMIGYYAERPMVDFAGLLQPEITAQLTPNATYEDAAIWAVTKYSPQYLVLHDGVFQKLEQGYAAKQCTPEKHFYGKDYGYNLNMTIYHCR